MTLLDAPKFDAARDRRNALDFADIALARCWCSLWLVAGGRPACGLAVELEPLCVRAKHGEQFYDRARSQRSAEGLWRLGSRQELAAASTAITVFILSTGSRTIGGRPAPTTNTVLFTATRLPSRGTTATAVLVAILINGRKSDALDLDYDPRTGQLSFAPPGVSLYLGP